MRHDRYLGGKGELETFDALALFGTVLSLYNIDMNRRQLANDKKDAKDDRERACRIEQKLDYIINEIEKLKV